MTPSTFTLRRESRGGVFLSLLYTLSALGCERASPLLETTARSEPTQISSTQVKLRHRAYVWRAPSSDELDVALRESEAHLEGLDLLYATVSWRDDGQLEVLHHAMPSRMLHAELSIGAVIRVELPRAQVSFTRVGEAIAAEVRSLIQTCARAGVQLSLVTIDADPPTRLLDDYIEALHQPRVAAGELPLTVTALIDHTRSSSLKRFAEAAGHLTLQLHSLEVRSHRVEPLVDRRAVREALKHMSALGLPYAVSLPTYGYLVRLSRGKLRHVYAERSWPPPSHRDQDLIVSARPREIAALLSEWRSAPPRGLERIHWFRLPLSGDRLNWRWRTLSAVLRGTPLRSELKLICNRSADRVYLSIQTRGDIFEHGSTSLRVTWDGASPQEVFAEGSYRGVGARGALTFTPVRLGRSRSHVMSRQQWVKRRAELEGRAITLGSAVIPTKVREISLERASASGEWETQGEPCQLR